MPTELEGALELRRAIAYLEPDLAVEVRNELAKLLRPIVAIARGYIPSTTPLSGWRPRSFSEATFPIYDGAEAKRGVGYRTSPSKPNREGWVALARIVNHSAAGAIYETAGRKNPYGAPLAEMDSPFAGGTYVNRVTGKTEIIKYVRGGHKYSTRTAHQGKDFIAGLQDSSPLTNANKATGPGRRSRMMTGRAIFRAWAEDGGKTNAAVIKALETSRDKFYSNSKKAA